jgi:phosphate acyltransferase
LQIAVDAMGGDYAPGEIVRGAVAALQVKEDLRLIVVGQQSRVSEALLGLSYPPERLTVLHADEVINGSDDPGLAIRSKRQSSMVKGLQLVRTGQADAFLSAGNTGALMAGGLLFLGRLSGIDRPALLAVMPSFSGEAVVILDVGANMDARPEQLLQYAHMGRIYAQKLLGISEPRVALLNVGTEPRKGNAQVKKAYTLFEEQVPGFCGNIEGTDLFFNAADVVVCDGFVGNILLKITEGLARGVLGYFKEEFKRSARYRAGAALLYPALRGLREKIDDAEYGGAPLVGVKGICIKCHGSSRARTIEQAIICQVYPFAQNGVIDLFRKTLRETKGLAQREDIR